ncbi:WxL domain-containing protein [Arthrobacter sp. MDT3-44]
MRNVSRLCLAVGASAVLVGSLALPASAADTATTTATVEVPAGSIAISAPGAVVALTGLTPGQSVTAAVDGVTVTDDRAGVEGWSVQVGLSDFTGQVTGDTIPASGASYTPGVAVKAGTSTVTATTQASLSVPGVVQSATGVNGNNTAAWNATLQVSAPSDALADVYTATLTHSVL